MLEDEQRYARDQIARRQQQNRQFPYAQRAHAPVPQQQNDGTYHGDDAAQQQPPQRDRDTMTEVQEQFSKLAESNVSSVSSLKLLLPPHTHTPPPLSFLPTSYLPPVATYGSQRPGSNRHHLWLRESPLLLLCTHSLTVMPPLAL